MKYSVPRDLARSKLLWSPGRTASYRFKSRKKFYRSSFKRRYNAKKRF